MSIFHIKDCVIEDFDSKDFFSGKKYSNTLAKAIENDEITSIAVYGKWGVGKTTIVRNALINQKKYSDKNIVTYNAWKYSKHDFMRDFLIECSKRIEGEEKAATREERYYSNQVDQIEAQSLFDSSLGVWIRKNWKSLSIFVVIYVIVVVATIVINNYKPNLYRVGDILIPLTTIFFSLLIPVIIAKTITVKAVDKIFSPEQFERQFKEIIGKKEVLIFIDDIDRCEVDDMKTTLDTIKTFIIDNEKHSSNVKFIISIDPNVMLPKLKNTSSDYFFKIFNHVLLIKNYVNVDYEKMRKEILSMIKQSEYKSVVDDGLKLAINYYIDTPRKLKMFANEFINELYNYKIDDIKSFGESFAKIIILKNEYPEFYDCLSKNYNRNIKKMNDQIEDYERERNQEEISLPYSEGLLKFLSETKDVSLECFSLYALGISYSQYMLQEFIKNPIPKNAIDKKSSVDFESNFSLIKKSIRDNIVYPLSVRKEYQPGDRFTKVIFLLTELEDKLSEDSLKLIKAEIIKVWDELFRDEKLFREIEDDEEYFEVVDFSFLNDTIREYMLKLLEKNSNIINDAIVNKILSSIDSSEKKSIGFDLNFFSFIDFFKKQDELTEKAFINIINSAMKDNFVVCFKRLSYLFSNGNKCNEKTYVKKVFDNLGDEKLDEEYKSISTKYIANRYSDDRGQNNLIMGLNSIFPLKDEDTINEYMFIFEVIERIIRVNTSDYEKIKELILNLIDYFDVDETIDKLIVKILLSVKYSKNFDSSDYEGVLNQVADKFNTANYGSATLSRYISQLNEAEFNNFLNYSIEEHYYNNSNIISQNKGIFVNFLKDKNVFCTLAKTIDKNEGSITSDLIEDYGFSLKFHIDSIKYLISTDVVGYIYLLSPFSFGDIKDVKLNISENNYNQIDFSLIKGDALWKKIKEIYKKISEEMYSDIKANEGSDINIFHGSVNKYIEFIKFYYNKLNVENKKIDHRLLWKHLLEIEGIYRIKGDINLYKRYLQEDQEFRNVIKNGNYKKNLNKSSLKETIKYLIND